MIDNTESHNDNIICSSQFDSTRLFDETAEQKETDHVFQCLGGALDTDDMTRVTGAGDDVAGDDSHAFHRAREVETVVHFQRNHLSFLRHHCVV